MTAEQAALVEKARSSLQAARLLSEQGFFDFSVSRSYYSMFYVAEALLLGEGLVYSKHSAVIAAFGQHFAKSGRVPAEFHRYLIEAEDSRKVGDYDMMSKLSAKMPYSRQIVPKNSSEWLPASCLPESLFCHPDRLRLVPPFTF